MPDTPYHSCQNQSLFHPKLFLHPWLQKTAPTVFFSEIWKKHTEEKKGQSKKSRRKMTISFYKIQKCVTVSGKIVKNSLDEIVACLKNQK